MKPSVTVFMPAYNEQDNIEGAVREAAMVLTEATDDPEIVVVNDGSTDKTGELLVGLKNEIPFIRVIEHKENLGIARSIIDGINYANKEFIFFNSADRQAPMEYLLRMLPEMKNFDLLVGFFYKRKDSFLRLVFSKVYHLIIRILFGIKLHNVNALKLFKKGIFRNTDELGDNLCIDTEIILLAMQGGYRVGEIKLEHFPRSGGRSTVVSLRNIMRTFCSIFDLYIRSRKWQKK